MRVGIPVCPLLVGDLGQAADLKSLNFSSLIGQVEIIYIIIYIHASLCEH